MADDTSRAGTSYATPAILTHLHVLQSPHDAALEAAFTAPARLGLPAIMVGPAEGKLLTLLARLVGARRILEVGALAGYSTLRLAQALPADGTLVTIDHDPRALEATEAHLRAAGLRDRCTLLLGDGVARLADAAAHGPFDLVFLDADKGRYDVYAEFAATHLRDGGLLVVDNAFFFGRLLDDDPDAAAVRRCHERLAADFDAVTIPTPDGLGVGIRRPRAGA